MFVLLESLCSKFVCTLNGSFIHTASTSDGYGTVRAVRLTAWIGSCEANAFALTFPPPEPTEMQQCSNYIYEPLASRTSHPRSSIVRLHDNPSHERHLNPLDLSTTLVLNYLRAWTCLGY